MFVLKNYFRQYNDNKYIDNYKEFYKKFSNEREFGADFSSLDHLIQNRFVSIFGHMNNIVLKKRPKKILDIGCGNGINLQLSDCYSRHLEYFAIDYAEKTVEVAQKTYPNANIQCMDAFNMTFEDKSFDMIILSSVYILYEKMEDRQKLLLEAKRVLKDDGILVLTVWNEAPLVKFSVKFSEFISKLKNISLPQDFMGYMFSNKDIKFEALLSSMKVEETIYTAKEHGILDSARYLTLERYNRNFNNEKKENLTYPNSIKEDIAVSSGSRKLSGSLFCLSKLFPSLFYYYSINILTKIMDK